jgi:hypothetical protein
MSIQTKIRPKVTLPTLEERLTPRFEAARQWLGSQYLLAQPINKRKIANA